VDTCEENDHELFEFWANKDQQLQGAKIMSETTATPRAPIAFVDTETDGVHPNRRPWEIAVIRREPDGRETEWTAFVEIDLSSADPFGLRVGKFYDRHPLGRHIAHGDDWSLASWGRGDHVSLRDAAFTVAQMTHGAHLVGATPNFDAEVFDRLLRSQGLLPGWHYHLIDVGALALGALAAQGLRFHPPYKTDQLTSALGVELATDAERHTALGDTRWAMRVYDAVMNPEPAAVDAELIDAATGGELR